MQSRKLFTFLIVLLSLFQFTTLFAYESSYISDEKSLFIKNDNLHLLKLQEYITHETSEPINETFNSNNMVTNAFYSNLGGSIASNILNQLFTLNIYKIGTGLGIVSSNTQGIFCGNDCSEDYAAGTPVTLIATPAQGSVFNGWGHDCSTCGTNQSCQIIMNSSKNCTASFTTTQTNLFNINTIVNPINGGSIKCDPNPVPFGARSICQITANDGYVLDAITFTCPGMLSGNIFTTSEIYSNCSIEARFKLLVSNIAPKIIACDLNNDKKHEIIRLTTDEQISYYSLTTRSWTNINGRLSEIACGDLDGNKITDLVGLNKKGEIWYTSPQTDGQFTAWRNIHGILKKIYTADINSDGKDEIIGLNDRNEIYVFSVATNWTKIPGNLEELVITDFNTIPPNKKIAGINLVGQIYLYDFNYGWSLIPGNLKKLATWKASGLGLSETIIGINIFNEIYYLGANSNWIRINGFLKDLTTGDLDGDTVGDIIGINDQHDIYYTLNKKDWQQIKGKALQITTGDLNGDNKADVIVVGMDGKIYYTLDRLNWVKID